MFIGKVFDGTLQESSIRWSCPIIYKKVPTHYDIFTPQATTSGEILNSRTNLKIDLRQLLGTKPCYPGCCIRFPLLACIVKPKLNVNLPICLYSQSLQSLIYSINSVLCSL
ncbi:hypothetical protein S83_010603 [Arachis hypogaea]